MTIKSQSLMIGLVVLLSVVASWAVGQGAPPQPAPANAGHRTAVVDLVRIFEECSQIKDLESQMRISREDFMREGDRRQKAIEAKDQELKAFKPDSDDYRKRRDELMRMRIEATVWAQVTEAGQEQKMFDWTALVYKKAVAATNGVATSLGYDLVLQRRVFEPTKMPEASVQALRRAIQGQSVVFNVPQVDLTNLVLARMNADHQAAARAGPPAGP